MPANVASQRIRNIPPYLFAEIDKMKAGALKRGIDVIDLGIGDPDLEPPRAVVDALIRGVQVEGSHHYASYDGVPRLREAFARWYEGRYGVRVNPETEVLPLLGSKEGIGHIFLSLIDGGQEVLIPDPGYPVYTAGTILAGGTPVYFPLRRKNAFLPDMKELKLLLTPHTKMMWINYPSNPTAAVAGVDTFQGIVDFAAANGLVVCHDAAYSEIVYNGGRSCSILQASGGMEVSVEFHSLSKTFCMPGWRIGFAVGNADVIQSLARVKTNLDSGIFLPVQEAAITALTECEEDARERCAIFEARCNQFVEGLRKVGWDVPLPPATFYVWTNIPRGYDSMGFCSYLLDRAGVVCTPGIGFGKHGEGFVRMSLTFPEERLEAALERFRSIDIKWG